MLCVYCGEREADTEDHVVPEGFFEAAPEAGHIKVPACYDCNNKRYSRDEEYFLVAILAEATATSNTANRVLDRLAADHQSGRRRRIGLAVSLLEKVRPVEVHSPVGLYVGTGSALELDTARVNSVLEKIVRGLFFHRFQRPLRPDARVVVEIKPEPDRLRSPLAAAALAEPPSFLGDVFMHRVYSLPENPDCTSWALGFYDAVLAIAATGPPKVANEVM
jgi:hypothetical protein